MENKIKRDSWTKTNNRSYNRVIKEDKENPTIEAELGETILAALNDDNIPEHYNIKGKKHSQGGTKLNVPDGSFVYSDYLKVKDKKVLEMFNITDGKSRTFADIAKQYDVNKYKRILLDDESTKMERETAEAMMAKCYEKLGKLALIQESMKGFEDGLPDVSKAYLANSSVNILDVFKNKNFEQMPAQMPRQEEQAKEGGESGSKKYRIVDTPKKKYKIVKLPNKNKKFKILPKHQTKGPVDNSKSAMQTSYDKLEEVLNDEKTRAEFIRRFRANASQLQAQGRLSSDDVKRISKMSDDEIINNFKNGEDLVRGYIQNNAITKQWDTDNDAHREAAQQIGKTPLDVYQIGAFQLAYNTLVGMTEDKNLDADIKDKIKDFNYFATGPEHDQYSGRATNVSPVDGYFGDNTARQYIGYQPSGQSAEQAGKDWNHLSDAEKRAYAPFMTEDLINLYGAISDTDMLKKYPPWSKVLHPENADLAYHDFRTEAHRLNSGLRSMLSAQSQFTGPQQTAAMANESAATLAENMAAVTSNEHQYNIAEHNKFNLGNAERLDNINKINLDQKIKDYDNWVTLQDNFAREKLNYKNNVRNMLTNALANRGYLQNINSLHNDFRILPDGTMVQLPGSRLDPSQSDKSIRDMYKDTYEMVVKDMHITDPDTAMEMTNNIIESQYKQRRDAEEDRKEREDRFIN